MSRELVPMGGRDTHSRGGKGVAQPALKTRPSVLSTSPPTPFVLAATVLSLLSKVVPGFVIKQWGPSRFQVWTHQPPFPQHTTVGTVQTRWVGVSRTGGQPIMHTVHGMTQPCRTPNFRQPPSPSLGLPLPTCCQGTLEIMTCIQ